MDWPGLFAVELDSFIPVQSSRLHCQIRWRAIPNRCLGGREGVIHGCQEEGSWRRGKRKFFPSIVVIDGVGRTEQQTAKTRLSISILSWGPVRFVRLVKYLAACVTAAKPRKRTSPLEKIEHRTFRSPQGQEGFQTGRARQGSRAEQQGLPAGS